MKKIFILFMMMGLLPSLSNATPIIGTPTTSIGTTSVVTSSYFDATTGKIRYFIPLDNGSTGVYGVDDGGNYGLSPDSAEAPLGGSVLDMYIYFDIADGLIGETLTLWFDDLDLKSINDPRGFFETLTFNETTPGELGGDIIDGFQYTQWDELEALDNVKFPYGIPNDNNSVTITISGLELKNDFWLNLQFTSLSVDLSGWYSNTPEYLSATLTTAPVPEPSTLLLLGSGLVGIFFWRRRQGLIK